jgi:hypothetical protein
MQELFDVLFKICSSDSAPPPVMERPVQTKTQQQASVDH